MPRLSAGVGGDPVGLPGPPLGVTSRRPSRRQLATSRSRSLAVANASGGITDGDHGGPVKMVVMDEAFEAEDEHVRFAAYLRAVDGGEPLEGIVDQLVNDPDQVMADGVRIRLLDQVTTRDDVTQLLDRPGFSSRTVLRKAEERFAVLDARQAQSQDQFLAVVATGIKKAHLELLERHDLPQDVLVALVDAGATRAIRNRARQRSGRR